MYAAIDKLKLYRLAEQLFPQLFKLPPSTEPIYYHTDKIIYQYDYDNAG